MNQIIVENSESQKCFHRTTFQERLINQRICRHRGFKSDYEPIATFETVDEADAFIQRCQESKMALA